MLISVLICSYNAVDTLKNALHSVFAQTLCNSLYEVLLVDDGSTDGTSELASSLGEKYTNFRYISMSCNYGLVDACNRGLALARGKYLMRLDADDVLSADILEACVSPLENNQTDLVYSDRYEVNIHTGDELLVQIETFDLFQLIACGVMMRTDLLRRIGGYRHLFWEEYDLFIRYLQRSSLPPVRIHRALYRYHRHSSSMTGDPNSVREGWRQLSNMWGVDVLKSYGWMP